MNELVRISASAEAVMEPIAEASALAKAADVTVETASPEAQALPADEDEKLQAHVRNARVAHRTSKTSATEAAVHCYLVYRGTLSSEGKKWLGQKIDAANAAIKQHNADEKLLKERVAKFKADSVATASGGTVSVGAAALTASDAAMLADLAILDDDAWDRRRKVLIAARNGTAPWTAVVKWVLDLTSPYNASVISRYVRVVAWLARKHPHATDGDFAGLCAAILGSGGFDAVYAEQCALERRGNDDGEGDDASDHGAVEATDAEIIAAHKAEQVKAGLQALPALSSLGLQTRHASNGFTLLLARVTNAALEIVGEAEVASSQISAAVAKQGSAVAAKPYAGSRFLWNVFQLGELVSHGQTTKLTRFGLNAGEPLKVERRMVLRNKDAAGGYEVMISARNADASIIIKATPTQKLVKLGPPKGLLGLSAKSYDAIRDMLSDVQGRSLWDVKAVHDPLRKDGREARQTPAWQAVCHVLKNKGSKNHTKTFYLNDITQAHNLPLDVDGFRPEVVQDLKKSDLEALYRDRKSGWDKVKKADKTGQIMSLEFKNCQLTLKAPGQGDYSVPTHGNGSFQMLLQFRAQELMAVLGQLCDADAKLFTLSADKAGLLIFHWTDAVGSYQVCLPTANSEGRLQSRRLAPISIAETFFEPQQMPTEEDHAG